jgi:hypothetical protein
MPHSIEGTMKCIKYPLLNTCLNWFKIVKKSSFQGALCALQTPNKGLMIINVPHKHKTLNLGSLNPRSSSLLFSSHTRAFLSLVFVSFVCCKILTKNGNALAKPATLKLILLSSRSSREESFSYRVES